HINGPAAPAGPSMMTVGVELSGPCRLADLPDDRPVPAADPASVGRRPVAAGRAFARRHPAADPGAGCPAAVGSASAGSGYSCTAPACWFPQTSLLLTHGTAESCDAKRAIARAKFAPISALISPRFRRGLKAPSHPLVSTIVVDERGTVGPGAHRFDRAEKYIVAADRSDLDDAAIKRDPGRGEHGTASRQRQPISPRKPIAAGDAGAAREYVGDLRATVSQRVDAEYAVLHHDRIGLAAAIEA